MATDRDAPDPRYPSGHSTEFLAGYRRGSRDAMEWLRNRADAMNDPVAQTHLHSAATNMGWAFSRARGDRVPALPSKETTSE